MKTSELTGPALDWAVAKCKALDVYFDDSVVCLKGQPFDDNSHYWLPTQNWSQGGPIVEREVDQISRYEAYPDYRADRFATDDYEDCHAIGPTMLIAAMRCYVASKLGDEVDIPEELL